MELGLTTIVLILIGIWYFGSLLNTVAKKTNTMAFRQLDLLDSEHTVDIAQEFDNLGMKLEEMKLKHTKTSVHAMLAKLDAGH